MLLAILLVVQGGVSLLMRTHRVKGYLIAHLESAFGRPVRAERFSMQILPIPELDVEAVTIAEDPVFGKEYFLRAERMDAHIRWMGLLHGRIEFGTMSFTRPSLILVRNAEGRWNLEGWLPPARPAAVTGSSAASVARPAESTHHLQKIDFDDGRINFKEGDEKRPFAFTNVSGSVEQVSPGRWQLRLEAQPWRSGVALQSTGTLQVMGDVAGTSARLQPAQLRLHWGKVSLADLFRLITGNDSGVRGEFDLDGNASLGVGTSPPEVTANAWEFALQARAINIHRWDLNERNDNPRINVDVKGHCALAAGVARAEELRVELPRSNLEGSAVLQTSGIARWRAQFRSMALQGEDLLAWYRAFQPNVAGEVALSDMITGSVSAHGWPLRWEDGEIQSTGGSLRLRGQTMARLDPFRGTIRGGKIDLEGFRLRLPVEVGQQTVTAKVEKTTARPKTNAVVENTMEAALTQDSEAGNGGLRLNLHLTDAGPVFEWAAAFGRLLNKGWEYKGGASGTLTWNWVSGWKDAHRTGSLELTKARLQVAGLNEPLKVEDARLEWEDGVRNAVITRVDAFGAEWNGAIFESARKTEPEENNWHFRLHADHLDAAELDRWVGPRARPNWLQRLLPSLLGSTNTAQASELLRRVSAEGELTADTLTVEKIKLTKAHAELSLHALHLGVRDAEAQWSGGTVRGEMQALFTPLPRYELKAEVENVNLAQLPWPPRWGERWSGFGSGKIHLATSGVGKEDLLKRLAGGGDVKLTKIEFRGWDVEQSAESGGPSGVSSRWASGEGEFRLNDQKVTLDGFRLDAPHQRTQLQGTISFGMDGNLTFAPRPRAVPGTRRISQARELRLSGQLENPAVVVVPVGSEQARP
jgi:AsmA family/AsmA-like C-terminal region